MSAPQVTNPPISTESKSAKKKKAKGEIAAVTNGDHLSASPTQDSPTNGDSTFESPYMRELFKSIRNVNKKINASQKVDSILAENSGKSLDELVAARKINADQKAQVLKKPALLAQLASLEEQVSQYKKFDQDYQNRMNAEKEQLLAQHKEELAKVQEAAQAEAKAQALKDTRGKLLIFSKFLRAAAANRENTEESDESKAFEGALLQVYGGDANAVTAAEKLIEGTSEALLSIEGETLDFTYAQLKEASLRHAPVGAEDAWIGETTETVKEESSYSITTDPTQANAGLTEIDNPIEPVNGVSDEISSPVAPEQTSIDAGAGNAAAESHWDTKMSASAESGPEGWVEVPRDPTETETGTAGVPAPQNSTESWADDHPVEAPPVETASVPATNGNGNDGFHEVHHGRGGRGRGHFQGERRGSQRGRGGFRGGEGGYRGRGGFRGDRGEGGHRGRGRGGFRGGRGNREGRETPY